jgi:esterase
VPARLYHERIARSDATPARWLALTHGIYGAGSNWRSVARKLNERRPEWGVVLVDLRQHGRSEPGAPPHTIAACADDLRALFAEIGGVEAVAGHSFGGKVALATRPVAALRQTWVLDASPSARPGAAADPTIPRGALPPAPPAEPAGSPPPVSSPSSSNTVMQVLELMERAPRGWARREDFVASVVRAGHDDGLARWLAMSLGPEPGGTLALRFDFAALREMLASYHATDLWGALEAPGGDVEVVVAERSPAVSAADRGRLAAAPPHVHVHAVDAGHWLHIEAPGAVVDLLASRLP